MAGHHGYFEKTGVENEQVVRRINHFAPDILFVGFGMPLQERWILANRERLNTRVFLPLGACLDFYVGDVWRGPKWLTNHGLEWLTRLLTEPRRLWPRYLIGNAQFLGRCLKYRIGGTPDRSNIHPPLFPVSMIPVEGEVEARGNG